MRLVSREDRGPRNGKEQMGTGAGTETTAAADKRTGTRTRTERGERELGNPPHQNRRVDQALPFPRGISVDRKWHLQVASCFGRKTRCLSDHVVPRGETGPRNRREETVMGKGTGTGTRAGIEAETGTRTERMVKG